MQHFDVNIRPIEVKDNAILAQLIRQSLEHYHLDLPGTSYTDPQLDHLFEHYQQQERSAFFVLAEGQQILGCGGYGQIQEGFPLPSYRNSISNKRLCIKDWVVSSSTIFVRQPV